MNEFVVFGVYIITELFSLYCMNLLYSCFFEKKKISGMKIVATWLITLMCYALPHYLVGNWLLNLVFALISYVILTFLYVGDIKYKIIIVVFGYIINLVGELGTMLFWKLFFVEYEGDFFNLIFSSISRIVVFIVIECIRLTTKKNNKGFYKPYYWWLVLIIPGGSMYIICQTSEWVLENPTASSQIPILLFIMILLAINISVFYLYDKLVDNYVELFYMEQVNSQNKFYQESLEKEIKNISTLRTWRHDILNFLEGLTGPVIAKDFDEAAEMIDSKLKEFQKINYAKYSGNAIIDAIINCKKELMDKNRITFTGEFMIPEKLNIESNDLTILLGNSLDNAIEACIKMEPDNRNIRMILHYSKGMLLYKVENSCPSVIPDHHLFRSTKKSPDHGLGLRSIEGIVRKYDGKLDAKVEDDKFILDIAIFTNNK